MRVCVIALLAAAFLYVGMQYGRLGTPLFWQDEAETAMFGQRILEHGIPKVHGAEGVVYGMSVPMVFATDAGTDAYTGSRWGQYYVAAVGVATSQMADDLHTRTALVRLPFALFGSAGLVLAGWAFLPAISGRGRRCALASVYLLGLATSVSLQLHLREVRYYALVTFCVGFLLFVKQRASGASRASGVFAGLLVLFNVFYPAAVAMGAWLALETAWPILRDRHHRPPGWPRELMLGLAPVAAAGLAAIPIFLWFRMGPLSALMSARYEFGLAGYLANLLAITRHLALHEFALAALILRVAAISQARNVKGPAGAASLWRLVLIWLAVGARNPIFFERYFVALGPVLLLAGLLDFDRLRVGLEATGEGVRRNRRVLGVLAGVCVLGSLALKVPELSGRMAELSTPVVGPLDVAIPRVAAQFEDPAGLVIATNYEAEAWMFYLGARVVGRFHEGSEAEARAEAAEIVDVVVPRRGYPHTFVRMRDYMRPGEFELQVLDVADLPYNTIPELSPGRVLAVTHPFRTVSAGTDSHAGLAIWIRRSSKDESR